MYGQKTDLEVLNIFSIKTYQIFPAGISVIYFKYMGEQTTTPCTILEAQSYNTTT